jgi:16S rRNA (guanine527-N7)-methyltransferase
VTDATELQALAAGIGTTISRDGATRLLAYLDALLAENRHVNLTAVREREAAVLFHALDSLALATGVLDEPPQQALDLGTGNGFPGVAIACVFPEARVTLMDRTLKKLKAIERALAAAGFDLKRFETIQMNASEAPAHGLSSRFDLITARAVGTPAEVGRIAKPLLAGGGRLLLWLGGEVEAPLELKGGLRRVSSFEYALPAPAERLRRLVGYGHG